ncbi:carbohydrate kinase family protein [Trueperella sp. LYQ143]|uniref:carbohydrate kinase family protein n=1 Tax=unclassified Trueperella TaxID=2630174 RepID=UPI003982DD1B
MSCLVIGESLIDVVKRADGTTTRHPGGSPMNVAVGLARLGRNAHLLTRIGDDADGLTIRRYLDNAGVHLLPDSIVVEPTSIALATIDDYGAPTYRFDVHCAYREPPTSAEEIAELLAAPPQHVHIGSIGAHLHPGADTVRRWIELLHPYSTISYDPNVRLSILRSAQAVIDDIARLVPYLDVVKASAADLAELAGHPIDPDEAAARFLNAGVKLVAITTGADGMRIYTGTHSISVPAASVTVVDCVGAGDALMAALIDGLARVSVLGTDGHALSSISAKTLTSVATYAVAAAGITVSRAGANPPTRDELIELGRYFTI